jgi:hypothetical protein
MIQFSLLVIVAQKVAFGDEGALLPSDDLLNPPIANVHDLKTLFQPLTIQPQGP